MWFFQWMLPLRITNVSTFSQIRPSRCDFYLQYEHGNLFFQIIYIAYKNREPATDFFFAKILTVCIEIYPSWITPFVRVQSCIYASKHGSSNCHKRKGFKSRHIVKQQNTTAPFARFMVIFFYFETWNT